MVVNNELIVTFTLLCTLTHDKAKSKNAQHYCYGRLTFGVWVFQLFFIYLPTGIENLENVPAFTELFDVYDLSGRKVRHQVNSLDGLPDGIYIVNGKKMLKK